jgi:hypothetical protein
MTESAGPRASGVRVRGRGGDPLWSPPRPQTQKDSSSLPESPGTWRPPLDANKGGAETSAAQEQGGGQSGNSVAAGIPTIEFTAARPQTRQSLSYCRTTACSESLRDEPGRSSSRVGIPPGHRGWRRLLGDQGRTSTKTVRDGFAPERGGDPRGIIGEIDAQVPRCRDHLDGEVRAAGRRRRGLSRLNPSSSSSWARAGAPRRAGRPRLGPRPVARRVARVRRAFRAPARPQRRSARARRPVRARMRPPFGPRRRCSRARRDAGTGGRAR